MQIQIGGSTLKVQFYERTVPTELDIDPRLLRFAALTV